MEVGRFSRVCPLDDQGTVFAEYIVVMALVTLGLGLATYALGPKLYGVFAYQRMVLSIPLI